MRNAAEAKGMLWVVCLSLMLSFGFADRQKAEIRVENGIKIVRNARNPVPQNGVVLKLKLTEDLRIGDSTSGGGSSFAVLMAVLVDDQENIIAFDRKDVCFKVFDKTGRFILQFGKKGQGPDEIERVMGVKLSEGKDVAVLDFGNNRLSFYSQDGVCFNRINLKKLRPYAPVMSSRGDFYGTVLSFADKPGADLVKLDPELNPAMTVASLVLPRQNEIPPAELMERFIYQIGKDDSFIWGSNFKYELNVMDASGRLCLKISRDAEPQRVTRSLLVKEFKKRFPDKPAPDGLPVPDHYPKHLPYFSSIVCDDEGRVFVRTLEGYSSGRVGYDVFDKEGIYVARIDLPEMEEITEISRGKAYAMIRESEDGNPLIKRYKISWERLEVQRRKE